MMSGISLPSREYVLAHGLPAEVSVRLRTEARIARARALAGSVSAGVEAVRRLWRSAVSHSAEVETKAL